MSKPVLLRIFRYFYFRIKPITIGPDAPPRLNVIEKPITIGLGESRGLNVVEKPITIGPDAQPRLNVVEKPITIGLGDARGLPGTGACWYERVWRSQQIDKKGIREA
ncbi:hypothetical protein [Paenibacillus sp. FSL R7-0179]|uniref:hypothetical protein n=1 Tax=Paenibacillus sp. FSL R7-0179 TaxID=2921672 RepID=UPI0030F8CA4E